MVNDKQQYYTHPLGQFFSTLVEVSLSYTNDDLSKKPSNEIKGPEHLHLVDTGRNKVLERNA